LAVYAAAYPGIEKELPDESTVNKFVAEMHELHSSLSQVRFWRVLTAATVKMLDDVMQGEEPVTSQTYGDVMADLRES